MTPSTNTTRVPLIIGGQPADPSGGRYFDTISQLSGQTIASVAAAGADDASRAVDAAAAAAAGWADTPPGERRRILENAARLRTERTADIAAATVTTGGTADGLFYPPTVLAGVTRSARIYSEESFGPLAPIIEVDGVEEAIDVANDSQYGLAAALFTRDVGRGLNVAKRIKSGICHINGATVHDEAQMPFGGLKSSGFGRFGSPPPPSKNSPNSAGSPFPRRNGIIQSDRYRSVFFSNRISPSRATPGRGLSLN